MWDAESGKYNTENHDASGEDTECEWITCDENEYAYIDDDTKECVVLVQQGLIMLLGIH